MAKKDERLGDTMPTHRNVKWGSMVPGESHLSDEFHGMEASAPKMSEEWVEQEPSKGHMSDKWVEMEAGNSPESDKWHGMKQEKRVDPYSMAPNYEDREVGMKEMKKEKADNRVNRPSQHTEFGSTREI